MRRFAIRFRKLDTYQGGWAWEGSLSSFYWQAFWSIDILFSRSSKHRQWRKWDLRHDVHHSFRYDHQFFHMTLSSSNIIYDLQFEECSAAQIRAKSWLGDNETCQLNYNLTVCYEQKIHIKMYSADWTYELAFLTSYIHHIGLVIFMFFFCCLNV